MTPTVTQDQRGFEAANDDGRGVRVSIAKTPPPGWVGQTFVEQRAASSSAL